MKKVLHISNYFPPHIGGIEQTAQDIVNVLKGKYEQKVICFNNGEKHNIIEYIDNVEIIRMKYFIKVSSQAVSFCYKKILKNYILKFKPDIIHIHLPNPLVVRYLNKCKYKGKIIIHHHLDIINQKLIKLLINKSNKKIYDLAKKIIVTSENYKLNSLELKNYQDKVEIVYSTINDNELLKNNLEISIIKEKYKNKFIAFFIGRHVKYKGLTYLIEVAKKLPSDFIFLIAGEGKLTKDLKKQAGFAENIKFLGRITNQEKNSYLHACDIFCFPSITKNEAFGLSLAEALYCGKPAITFSIKGSGVNFVNLNNITGLEVPLIDIDAYKEAIKKLEENKLLYEQLSNNAAIRTKELFTITRFNKSIIELYNDL